MRKISIGRFPSSCRDRTSTGVIPDRPGWLYAMWNGSRHGISNSVLNGTDANIQGLTISHKGQARRCYPLNLNGFLAIHRTMVVLLVKYREWLLTVGQNCPTLGLTREGLRVHPCGREAWQKAEQKSRVH